MTSRPPSLHIFNHLTSGLLKDSTGVLKKIIANFATLTNPCVCVFIYTKVSLLVAKIMSFHKIYFLEKHEFSLKAASWCQYQIFFFLLHSHWLNERVSTCRADFIHTSHRCLFGVTAKYDPVSSAHRDTSTLFCKVEENKYEAETFCKAQLITLYG